jgi:predicted thioesterase
MPLEPGLGAEIALSVTPSDTARALGSGDVPVLATPRILALGEQATVAAVAGYLEPGSTTVGVRAEVDHLAPSAVGSRVRARALLESVEGRRLVFTFEVTDQASGETVARGTVHRVAVDRQRFLEGR